MRGGTAARVEAFRAAVALRGLDVSGTCRLDAYNRRVSEPYRIGGSAEHLVVVLGNSRALWAHVDAYARAAAHRDPVDEYARDVVEEERSRHLDGLVQSVHYAPDPPPNRVLFQQLGEACNVARLVDSIHHSVHPRLGAWLSYRAALVLKENAKPEEAGLAPDERMPMVFDVEQYGGPESRQTGESSSFVKWLAVRDAVPVGREHRFPEAMIRYHYTGQRPDGWK